MITAVTTAFVTMAQSQAQRLADIAVTIGLPGGVYPDVSLAVQSVDVEFSATTSQPVRTQPGLPSATANFTLSGQIDPSDPRRPRRGCSAGGTPLRRCGVPTPCRRR
jgi:hypothetical protein